ncbi:Uncharacterized protein BM_BM5153, partial [Brugia malayi]|uniref:Bm5153 n=1 Tax=Brugia malayi TaxID=6279 RepID=A0A0K0JHR0_BRUMA
VFLEDINILFSFYGQYSFYDYRIFDQRFRLFLIMHSQCIVHFKIFSTIFVIYGRIFYIGTGLHGSIMFCLLYGLFSMIIFCYFYIFFFYFIYIFLFQYNYYQILVIILLTITKLNTILRVL